MIKPNQHFTVSIFLVTPAAKKNDPVDGKYVVELDIGAQVTVKVTDMLGEEVLSV